MQSNKFKNYFNLVMFSHTLFSLPFALIAMVLATRGVPDYNVLFWGIIALIGARTGANAFNRIADRHIDKENPRTNHRHLPQNQVSLFEAYIITIGSYLIYFIAAYKINELCFKLAIIPIVLFTIYPYTKRFTNLCHLFLGFCCAMGVFGGWIAVTNHLFSIAIIDNILFFDIDIIPVILFSAVLFWNAGFDIIYATQDLEHDQNHNLHSIPATFGLQASRGIAFGFHFIMMVLLFSLVIFYPFTYIYIIGLMLASILLIMEHKIIDVNNKVLMRIASYRLNQVISITIFIAVIWDVIL